MTENTLTAMATKVICDSMAVFELETSITNDGVVGVMGKKSITISPKWLLEKCKIDQSEQNLILEVSRILEKTAPYSINRLLPFLLTTIEAETSSKDIYTETLDSGEMITYYDPMLGKSRRLLSKGDSEDLKDFKTKAFTQIQLMEDFDFKVELIEGEVFVRILDRDCQVHPKVMLLTGKVKNLISEKFGDEAYLVVSESENLFAFSADEDCYETLGDLVHSQIGATGEQVSCYHFQNGCLENVMTLTLY